jgi:hypothetical protein
VARRAGFELPADRRDRCTMNFVKIGEVLTNLGITVAA